MRTLKDAVYGYLRQTADGKAFDVGQTCSVAIMNYPAASGGVSILTSPYPSYKI